MDFSNVYYRKVKVIPSRTMNRYPTWSSGVYLEREVAIRIVDILRDAAYSQEGLSKKINVSMDVLKHYISHMSYLKIIEPLTLRNFS